MKWGQSWGLLWGPEAIEEPTGPAVTKVMSIFGRENARLSSPVRLEARFARGGILYNPVEFDRIEIWKFAETEKDGGVLVDVVDGTQIIQKETGVFFILYDPFLEGSPANPSPVSPSIQGPGSPDQDAGLKNIEANVRYYDRWWYRPDSGRPLVSSVGLSFFLYPDEFFVDNPESKFRFELKLDRKRVVKGEKLDIRAKPIPIPLHQERRIPLVQYLLPIVRVFFKIEDSQHRPILPEVEVKYTGKEGIIPTAGIATLPIGEYRLIVNLRLPNGQLLQFPGQPINVVD